MSHRLTKSRFKLGCECPTKLFYASQPQHYSSTKNSPFLEALAQGGYQVGELAKLMHPGGVEVETLDEGRALQETARHLARPEVTVFEAAIGVPDENLLVRVDVLQKTGTRFDLLEVKAKSWDPVEDSFRKKKGTGLRAEWVPYLLDVAFQAWVLRRARPEAVVSCHLVLVNKRATCTVDGLHQRFLARKVKDGMTGRVRLRCELRDGPMPASQGGDLLITMCVDAEVRYLHEEWRLDEQRSFEQLVQQFASACANGERVQPAIGSHCKGCEFRPDFAALPPGQASGFVECWLERSRCSRKELETEPLVLDLWNNRLADKQIGQDIYLLRDVDPDALAHTSRKEQEPGLSTAARQALQVQRARDHDSTAYLDVDELRLKIDGLIYPLHFVDFETAMVAIPFSAGRRPYEQMAFQFSHHVMHENGRVVHHGQYLDMERGGFPNYRFVRELEASLGGMGGTLVHFASHENTVMGQVRRQLLEDPAPVADRDSLVQFLQAWASPPSGKTVAWQPIHRRIDLLEWILRHFYHPEMRGSNSIKAVLPAIMQSSTVLERRYGKPTYGTQGGIPSLNYEGVQWFDRDETGGVRNPYEFLGPVFSDEAEIGFSRLFDDEGIREGGAAMTAYMRMQFEDMADVEREAIRAALLRYCELDTLAMVMVFEHLKAEVGR